jgi:hypothetical protein
VSGITVDRAVTGAKISDADIVAAEIALNFNKIVLEQAA